MFYNKPCMRHLPILQLCAAVHEHALEIVEGQMMQQDALMSQLSQELDNGRLLRLLSRLVMVSEGNHPSLEPNWSETGGYPAVRAGCVKAQGTNQYVLQQWMSESRQDVFRASTQESSSVYALMPWLVVTGTFGD